MTILGSSLAIADTTTTPTPSASPVLGCDAFCGPLVNNSGQVENLNGTGAWSSTDDQWCATHGVQTNTAVGYNSASLEPNQSAAQTQQWLDICQWHNGQAVQQ